MLLLFEVSGRTKQKSVDIIIPHKGRNKALKHVAAHLPIISSCNENTSEWFDCGNKSIRSYLVQI